MGATVRSITRGCGWAHSQARCLPGFATEVLACGSAGGRAYRRVAPDRLLQSSPAAWPIHSPQSPAKLRSMTRILLLLFDPISRSGQDHEPTHLMHLRSSTAHSGDR